jgi:hypothetical protein
MWTELYVYFAFPEPSNILFKAGSLSCTTHNFCISFYFYWKRTRRSDIGTTCCQLGGQAIECRLGRDFPPPSRPTLGPTQTPVKWVMVLSPGGKRPVRGVDHPPATSAEVKERVELYLCYPLGFHGLF